MNYWIDCVKDCGFFPEIYFTKDGMFSVVLHGMTPTMERIRFFNDVDPDKCMADALTYALNYDAYVTNAAICSNRH